MSILEPSRSAWSARMLSVLGIVAGLVLFMAGTQKLFGFPPFPSQLPEHARDAGPWSIDALIARSRAGSTV